MEEWSAGSLGAMRVVKTPRFEPPVPRASSLELAREEALSGPAHGSSTAPMSMVMVLSACGRAFPRGLAPSPHRALLIPWESLSGGHLVAGGGESPDRLGLL